MVKRITIFVLLILFFDLHSIYPKTLLLDGELKSKITVTQSLGFEVRSKINSLSFRFALPQDYRTETVIQKVSNLKIMATPKPSYMKDEIDSFGNIFRIVTWRDIERDAKINVTFDVTIESVLRKMESKSEFPLKNIPDSLKRYLAPTEMVQSRSLEIMDLAVRLTENVKTEYEAVRSILNYVADHIKYTYNPPQYDALYTLKTGKGNCQNYAHLALALLRASGIPSRIVGGISLKEQMKIPIGGGDYLVQSMGQGGHAWIEIYFPDIGWLSYDPQQSRQFTSTRHIKQTHGMDSDDINDSWKASPYLPPYNENIEARFYYDDLDVKLISKEDEPRTYLISNLVVTKGGVAVPPQALERPSLPPSENIPLALQGSIIEFGNKEFPDIVTLYNVKKDRGQRILDKETSEYVTSRYIYAQSFTINDTMEIHGISLAMRRFGGDGTIYIDLVKDKDGRPGFEGVRSNLVYLERLKKQPGYYWVEFTFPEVPRLKKGRYWIILRHSGEAIMNWFYIPGNPYGDPDDTRSTVKGYKWEDILNYDFVFKVRALQTSDVHKGNNL